MTSVPYVPTKDVDTARQILHAITFESPPCDVQQECFGRRHSAGPLPVTDGYLLTEHRFIWSIAFGPAGSSLGITRLSFAKAARGRRFAAADLRELGVAHGQSISELERVECRISVIAFSVNPRRNPRLRPSCTAHG